MSHTNLPYFLTFDTTIGFMRRLKGSEFNEALVHLADEAVDARFDAAEGRIDTLETSLSNTQADVAIAQGNILTLQGQVSNLETNLSNLTNTVDQNGTTLTNLVNQVDNLDFTVEQFGILLNRTIYLEIPWAGEAGEPDYTGKVVGIGYGMVGDVAVPVVTPVDSTYTGRNLGLVLFCSGPIMRVAFSNIHSMPDSTYWDPSSESEVSFKPGDLVYVNYQDGSLTAIAPNLEVSPWVQVGIVLPDDGQGLRIHVKFDYIAFQDIQEVSA